MDLAVGKRKGDKNNCSILAWVTEYMVISVTKMDKGQEERAGCEMKNSVLGAFHVRCLPDTQT